MFGASLGTSMDFPNLHRKLFKGGAEGYTAIWTQRLREAQAAGLDIGVIAVLHQGSLDAGADAFYRYYTEELGLKSFQVNTPFPGGPAKAVEADFALDKTAVGENAVLKTRSRAPHDRGHLKTTSAKPRRSRRDRGCLAALFNRRKTKVR